MGLVPSTEWLGDRVETNSHKEIVVNREGATNVEGIFAAEIVQTLHLNKL